MRSGTQVQPGETQGIGCHDHRLSNQLPTGSSLARPPSKLTSWHGSVRSFGYLQEIQPIGDKHCVSCHDFGNEAGEKLVLAGDKELVFNASYVELFQNWGREGAWLTTIGLGLAPIKPAYATGAHRSWLVELLRQGHHEVQLAADEMDRIVTWIDIGGPYYPDYASAHPTNVAGRAPISIAQLNRLAELTGISTADGQGNPRSASHRLWIRFDRPELSLCLQNLDKTGEALTIIWAGQAELRSNPEADMRRRTDFEQAAREHPSDARSQPLGLKHVVRDQHDGSARLAVLAAHDVFDQGRRWRKRRGCLSSVAAIFACFCQELTRERPPSYATR